MDSDDEADGIWLVKYKGSLFTAATNSTSLTETIVGSSDEDDVYETDFIRGDAKRALLDSTAVNITLP